MIDPLNNALTKINDAVPEIDKICMAALICISTTNLFKELY